MACALRTTTRAYISACLLALAVIASTPGLVGKHRTFSDRLTVQPGGLWGAEPNVCSSSLGVSMAFDIVYPGSSGECRTQIGDTLGFPKENRTELVWAAAAARIQQRYTGASAGNNMGKVPLVRIVNSVWIDNATRLQPRYAQVVGNLVHQVDFNDGTRHVNAWCAAATEGVIPEILDPTKPKIDATMLAINAIYLNASWSNAFQAQHTNEDVFYADAARTTIGSSGRCHFMHQVSRFAHSSTAVPGFQIVQLPYVSSKLSMILALPTAAGASTTAASVLGALPNMEHKRVALALPKFKFRSTFDATLKKTLQSLGMTTMWQGGFDGIVHGPPLKVDSVVQKSFLYVWEKGTEAAAVTAISMKTTAAGPPPQRPVLFQADHPFQFWIYDSEEDIVMFEGRVGAPEVIPGTTAQSSAKHTGSDFWTSQFGASSAPFLGNGVTSTAVVSHVCMLVVSLCYFVVTIAIEHA